MAARERDSAGSPWSQWAAIAMFWIVAGLALLMVFLDFWPLSMPWRGWSF